MFQPHFFQTVCPIISFFISFEVLSSRRSSSLKSSQLQIPSEPAINVATITDQRSTSFSDTKIGYEYLHREIILVTLFFGFFLYHEIFSCSYSHLSRRSLFRGIYSAVSDKVCSVPAVELINCS